MLTKEDRAELATLYAEQDRLLNAPPSQLEAQGAVPVQREAPTGDLLYRRQENALATAAPDERMPSDAEPSITAEAVGRALGDFGYELRRDWREEYQAELLKRDRRISELEGEVREMKGMLGATLTLLGQKKQKLWTPGDAS